MVHLMCESVETHAKQDLEGAVRLLYNIQDDRGKLFAIRKMDLFVP